jgi:hypothetical protein
MGGLLAMSSVVALTAAGSLELFVYGIKKPRDREGAGFC